MEEKYRAQAREAGAYMIDRTYTVKLDPIETEDLLLDIGGGGEGVIGKLHGRRVIAIDKNIKELEETDNDSLKIVMDATDLKFLSASFEVVTAFFTLMYINNDLHSQVFNEVHRVLRDEGRFLIWDLTIPEKFSTEPYYGVLLKVLLPDEEVIAGYGIKWEDKEQDPEYFKDLAIRTGFKVTEEWIEGEIFFLELMKNNQI